MKNIFILLYFFGMLAHSQKKSDLYIIINSHKNIDIHYGKDDKTEAIYYRISTYKDCKKFSSTPIIKDGKIYWNFKWPVVSNSPTFILYYMNDKGNNPPKLVNEKEVANYFTYEELFDVGNIEDLMKIIESFDNVYVINESYKEEGWYIARKITFSLSPNL